VFTASFALGLVLGQKYAATLISPHILFGNVLGISDSDIQHAGATARCAVVLDSVFPPAS